MSDVASQPPRRWNFWLIASLCLNFFLIGVIVTGLLVARNRMIAGAMTGAGGGGLPPDVLLEMLPRSGAIKMCDALAARVENFRRLGREAVEARRGVFKIFRSEPFDAAAFRSALDRMTATQVAILQERQATIVDVVAKLTPEERKQFTRKIVQRFLSLAKPPGQGREPGRIAEICESIGAGSAKDLPQ